MLNKNGFLSVCILISIDSAFLHAMVCISHAGALGYLFCLPAQPLSRAPLEYPANYFLVSDIQPLCLPYPPGMLCKVIQISLTFRTKVELPCKVFKAIPDPASASLSIPCHPSSAPAGSLWKAPDEAAGLCVAVRLLCNLPKTFSLPDSFLCVLQDSIQSWSPFGSVPCLC